MGDTDRYRAFIACTIDMEVSLYNAIWAKPRKGGVLQVLHAQQQQRQRLKALSRFQGGKCAVLVATDVAARGLHIPDVEMVVQYQLPPTADTYIHRAGRTARAGAEGVCVSVVVPQESERFSRLHVALGQAAPQQFPVDAKVLRDLRARTRLAQRIDELERVNSKASADLKWMQRQSAAIGEPFLMFGILQAAQHAFPSCTWLDLLQ